MLSVPGTPRGCYGSGVDQDLGAGCLGGDAGEGRLRSRETSARLGALHPLQPPSRARCRSKIVDIGQRPRARPPQNVDQADIISKYRMCHDRAQEVQERWCFAAIVVADLDVIVVKGFSLFLGNVYV